MKYSTISNLSKRKRLQKPMGRLIGRAFVGGFRGFVPRKRSELRADVSEAAYLGLSLLGEFERRRDVADEYAGCHRCLDVFRLARCQTERNRVFDLGCRCYGVLSRGAVDVGE